MIAHAYIIAGWVGVELTAGVEHVTKPKMLLFILFVTETFYFSTCVCASG